MTLIAQLTDLHLREDGKDPCHDPAQALRWAFADIAQLDRRPDAILFTGDIIDRSAKGYAPARELLRQAPVRLLPMPGNHDRAREFRAAFGQDAPFHPDHLSFTLRVGGLQLVALDSNLPEGRGGLDAARLDWLRATLAAAETPVLLAMHHPPFPTHLPHLEQQGFDGADALATVIRGSAVCRLIAGHSHRGIRRIWAGVEASTAPAIGHALSLSLSGNQKHGPVALAPGYELHQLHHDGMVSHQMPSVC